jgi:imidazolonepropionase-like amidohydrolase
MLWTRGGVAQVEPVILRAAEVADGTGKVLSHVDLLIRDGRIVRISRQGAVPAGARLLDLRGRTLLPGLIDVHVHLTWYFNGRGRLHTEDDGDTPVQAALAAAANANRMLMAGFTTVQSIGAAEDAELRDAIAAGGLRGPRILTSLEPLSAESGGPDSLRALIRRRKEQGADLIKLFASASLREGGGQTMSDEQLQAACGEAASLGLRTLVHAHAAGAVRAAALAGCTEVEHGIFVTQEVLDLMASRGTYFDPQCGLVFHNYAENRAKYEGIGNYNEAGFSAMAKAIPLATTVLRQALATRGLNVVFGTDAVAGAHGRNAEDLVCWVREAAASGMDAIVAATSRNAVSLGLGDRLGRIEPGFEADLIAVDGDPTTDIEAIHRVSFVMLSGRVVRNDGAPPQ